MQKYIKIDASDINKHSEKFLMLLKKYKLDTIEITIYKNILSIFTHVSNTQRGREFEIINNNHNYESIYINAIDFFNIIKEYNNTIVMRIENNTLYINKKKLDAIEVKKYNWTISVHMDEFIDTLKEGLKFIDYYFNYSKSYKGIHIQQNKDKIDIMATNGRKLFYKSIKIYNYKDDVKLSHHGIIDINTIKDLILLNDKIEPYDLFLFDIKDNKFITPCKAYDIIEAPTPAYKNIKHKTRKYIDLDEHKIKEIKKAIREVKKVSSKNTMLFRIINNKFYVFGDNIYTNLIELREVDLNSKYNYELCCNCDYMLNILSKKELRLYVNSKKDDKYLFTSGNNTYIIQGLKYY